MCECQWLPRSHLYRSWPAPGPVQTEIVVLSSLGKCLFRPFRKTIFELLKLNCKTQQQLRWHKERLLSALALGIPTRHSGSQFLTQCSHLTLPPTQREEKKGQSRPFCENQTRPRPFLEQIDEPKSANHSLISKGPIKVPEAISS